MSHENISKKQNILEKLILNKSKTTDIQLII